MRLALTGIGLAVADLEISQLKENGVTGKSLPDRTAKTDTTKLNNYFAPRKLRRVDHFTRMTLLAACRSLHDHAGTVQENLKTPQPLLDDMGIILSTGYGPSETIFDFLDSIIDHGPSCASPLAFSHSVHNIPAATLSLFLSSDCPYTTLCQTHAPLLNGLNTAACWINEGRAKHVLLGLVDENTPILEENTKQILKNKNSTANIPLGEGACFFVLSTAEESPPSRYGTLEFETITPDLLSKTVHPYKVFAPVRSINRLEKFKISARTSIKTDMPTAAGVELAAAAMYASQKGKAACLEQAGKRFALIKVEMDQNHA